MFGSPHPELVPLPPNDKNQTRLERSRQFALAQGWDFEIWTEKDRLAHVVL